MGTCNIKSQLKDCTSEAKYNTGTLIHYDCADNNNCDGSFVRFQDFLFGTSYQKEKTYCGTEKPVPFFSAGNEAQVKIQLDSRPTKGTPEFRAKYKGILAILLNIFYTELMLMNFCFTYNSAGYGPYFIVFFTF